MNKVRDFQLKRFNEIIFIFYLGILFKIIKYKQLINIEIVINEIIINYKRESEFDKYCEDWFKIECDSGFLRGYGFF